MRCISGLKWSRNESTAFDMSDDEPYEDDEDESPSPFGLGERGDPAAVTLWRKRNAEARNLLGDSRLRTFFKVGRDFADGVAFDYMYEALARGEGLDILTRLEGESGYVLGAQRLGENEFRIQFGYRSGDGWSDGAVWRVRYDPIGSIQDIDVESDWPFLNGFGD